MGWREPSGKMKNMTDDRLIDYLLGEVTADGEAEILSWLAADEKNLVRLESLATVVSAVAGVASRPNGLMTVGRGDEQSSAAGDESWDRRSLRERRKSRWLTGLAAVVAASLLAGVAVDRFRAGMAGDEVTGQVALAWSDTNLRSEGEDGVLDELAFVPESGTVAWESRWGDWGAAPVPGQEFAVEPVLDWEGDDLSDDRFAADDETPPEWLVLAIARLGEQHGGEAPQEDLP